MQELTKQKIYSKNLRAMADWFDANPNVPIPYESLRVSAHFSPNEIDIIPEGRVNVIEPKSPTDSGLYQVFIDGDGFTVSFYCGVRRLCDQKVVRIDTKEVEVVEWVVKDELRAVPEEVVVDPVAGDDIPW
jgi:hypothetical protein